MMMMMTTTRLHISLYLVLLSITTSLSLAAAVPLADIDSPSSNDLNRLHHLNSPSPNLICHETSQRMSCYGGVPVTQLTCREICTCENGRISCPTYKYCDDATMDTFCGGMCGCSLTTSAKIRVNSDDRTPATPEIMLSGHHYPAGHAAAPRRHNYEEDDEEDDDDDLSMKSRAKRVAGGSRPGFAVPV